MDVFEAMGTARAIRYLKSDPVDRETLEKLVWAATRASSPGNSQAWDFVVITDGDLKARVGGAIAAAVSGVIRVPENADRSERLMITGALALAEGMADAPALVLVCGRNEYPPHRPDESMIASAVYPAAQNMIVAARALGLGATFTTFQRVAPDEIREALGIPDEVHLGALIPVGWPDREHGPVNRKPVEDVIHWDHWSTR